MKLDKVNSELVHLISEGCDSVPELVKRTGLSERVISSRIMRMKKVGVISAAGPRKRWQWSKYVVGKIVDEYSYPTDGGAVTVRTIMEGALPGSLPSIERLQPKDPGPHPWLTGPIKPDIWDAILEALSKQLRSKVANVEETGDGYTITFSEFTVRVKQGGWTASVE